jgi:hypothetical protein
MASATSAKPAQIVFSGFPEVMQECCQDQHRDVDSARRLCNSERHLGNLQGVNEIAALSIAVRRLGQLQKSAERHQPNAA